MCATARGEPMAGAGGRQRRGPRGRRGSQTIAGASLFLLWPLAQLLLAGVCLLSPGAVPSDLADTLTDAVPLAATAAVAVAGLLVDRALLSGRWWPLSAAATMLAQSAAVLATISGGLPSPLALPDPQLRGGFAVRGGALEPAADAGVRRPPAAPAPWPEVPAGRPGSGKISVVLPCAGEGAYAVKTVWSFCNRTPADVLMEIIVVDDGGDPGPDGRGLLAAEMARSVEPSCNVRVERHKSIQGLMIAKQTGGDAAAGEFIGFFDCHVAPGHGWHAELISRLRESPKRLVVPTITDLDIDAWDEKAVSATYSKCYIGWDADFMWFDDSSDFIPIISGGLVATTRQWWVESGGFDKDMRGWGGENVDQSLRAWLCGGDVVRARSSRVAHMWRVPEDSRTSAHYRVARGEHDNSARVAASWFGDFREKYKGGSLLHEAIDVSEVERLKGRLGCKPFAYFLHRFRRVYEDGGMLPDAVFRLEAVGSASGRPRCMQRSGSHWILGKCGSGAQFHLSNQNPKKEGRCCSGIRQWNTLECLDALQPKTGPLAYFCDVTGANANQQYWIDDASGLIHHGGGRCVSTDHNKLVPADCHKATRWRRIESLAPSETRLYREAVTALGLSDDLPAN